MATFRMVPGITKEVVIRELRIRIGTMCLFNQRGQLILLEEKANTNLAQRVRNRPDLVLEELYNAPQKKRAAA